MPNVLDCGDVTLTINIGFGLKFPRPAGPNETEEQVRRRELSEKLSELRASDEIKELEAELMTKAMKHLGYDDETIRANIEAREQARADARKAEEEGRRQRRERRIRARA